MPSFVHTGDIHLGKGFTSLGTVGRTIRQAQAETLNRIVQTVRETGSRFLIIAGDLFDSNSVSERMVKTALDSLASLSPTPVYILPGTHDVFDSSSVYRSPLFSKPPDNISVFPVKPTEFRPIPEVGVFGAANTAKRGGQRPLAALASLAEKSDAKYKVAVVHGSLAIPVIDSSSDEVLIEPAEVAAGPFDYIAVGHWHRRQTQKLGETWLCYSGCPETLSFEDSPSPGTVTQVNLDNEVVLEERAVGKNKWVTTTADVTLTAEAEIVKMAKNLSAANSLLRLRLVGTPGSPVDLDGLSDEITDLFLYVDIDDSQLVPGTPEGSGFPENSVAKAFVEIMNERIERAADAVEKDVLQEALRQGCLYLTGKAAMRL